MSKLKTTAKISPEDRAELRRSGGSKSHAWNSEIVCRTLATAFAAGPLDVDDFIGNTPTVEMAVTARTSMAAFAPANEVDAMLAAQAVGLHNGAMECLRRAAHPGDGLESASKLWVEAADLSRAMIDAVEALDRRRALAPAPAPAPQDPAPGPSWSAPPMYPPTPQAPASDVSAEDVCSLIVPGPGYRGGPYRIDTDPTER